MKQEKHHLEMLLANGNVEIRCIDKSSDTYLSKPEHKRRPIIWSGVYDDYQVMRQALIQAEKNGWDTYNTINPIKNTATNDKLRPFNRTAKDTDVVKLNTIFFDFDPIRTTGEAATDEQVTLSVEQAEALADFLTDEGWSLPVIGFSGNGCHLMYRTDVDIKHAKSLKGLYAGLEKRFTTDEVGFDVTVKNPARIARTYGTTNHKAGRKSSCASSDEHTDESVILKTIEKLTPPKPKSTWVKPKSETKAGKFIKNMDVVGLFKKAGLYLAPTQDNGKHFVTCFNAESHSYTSPSDSVIFEGEWAQFHCSHNSCSQLGIADAIGVLS